MAKAPAFQFYCNDWMRDMQEHPLEIAGAWINILCQLWFETPRGMATKPLKNWGKLLGKHGNNLRKILVYLQKNSVGNITEINGQTTPETLITIESRRMIRDEKIRELRKKVGALGGNPLLKKAYPKGQNLDNQMGLCLDKQNCRSSSSSSSSSLKKENPPLPPKGEPSLFDRFWQAYPRRAGKGAALKAWNRIKPSQALTDKILSAIAEQEISDQWRKDNGQYIPYPATWLNQGRWDDEPPTPIHPDPEIADLYVEHENDSTRALDKLIEQAGKNVQR